MKKNFMKENRGITLIAMIITIIVMLVLAGVSMNAIVGDNGILNQAINATTATSIAVLQEYLQEIYVENYDSLNASDSKVSALSSMSKYSSYFYNPSTDSGVGSLSYVVDSDGHALYLIKKSGLPEDIQKQLVGGDAGDGTYSDYVSLNDVYGITSDLEVYYCSSGVDSIQGLTVADLDEDNPARPVTIASDLATLLGIDANTTAQTLRAYKTLTIDSSVSSLSDLYNFSNLQVLTLDGAKLSSLSGIENCPYLYEVYCKSSTVGDYTAVGKLGSRLTHLYFYNINDEELETACSDLSSYDLPKLTYLAVVGNTSYISSTSSSVSSSKSSSIYSVSALNNLTSTTKQAVTYLSLQNNYLSSLDGISGFTGVTVLRCEYNLLTNLDDISAMSNLKYLICYSNSDLVISSNLSNKSLYLIQCSYCTSITSLSFLENCSSITYIYANYCTIGYGETSTKNTTTDSLAVLDGKTSLYYLSLKYNTNLAWIDYINSCSELTYLYLEGCTGLNSTSIYAIKSIIDTCAKSGTVSYPSQYSLALLYDNTTILDLSGETLSQDDFEVIGNYTQLTHLSLKNIVITDDDENEITNEDDEGNTTNELNTLVTDVLSNLTVMKYLQLYGMSNLSTIEFVENMEGLLELDVRSTSITDLSVLEEMTENESISFSLCTLAVDGSDIKLSTIPKTISKLGSNSASGYYYWSAARSNGMFCGLVCTGNTVLETLNGSTITKLYISGGSSLSGTIDLSSCSSLTTYFGRTFAEIKLPSSVVYCYTHCGADPSFASGTKLDTYYNTNSTSTDSLISSLANVAEIKTLNCATYAQDNLCNLMNFLYDKGIENLYCVKLTGTQDLTNFKIPESLETLVVGTSDTSWSLSNFPSSIFSESESALTKLTWNNSNLSSVEFLEDFTNLETANLSGNSISALQGIQYLTNATTLNLSDNIIVNTSTYNGTTYNNLELLSNLLEAGTLKTLNISSNSSINKETTQWTTLLSYNGKNGIKITY